MIRIVSEDGVYLPQTIEVIGQGSGNMQDISKPIYKVVIIATTANNTVKHFNVELGALEDSVADEVVQYCKNDVLNELEHCLSTSGIFYCKGNNLETFATTALSKFNLI